MDILVIVGIVVLLGVAGGCIFGIMKVQGLIAKIDTELDPKLDEIKGKVHAITPAVEQAGPLMESVNVTMDTIDVELVKLDDTLNRIATISGNIIGTVEAVPQMADEVKSTVKAGLAGKR